MCSGVCCCAGVSTQGRRERGHEGDQRGKLCQGQHVCRKMRGQRRKCLPPTARARTRRLAHNEMSLRWCSPRGWHAQCLIQLWSCGRVRQTSLSIPAHFQTCLSKTTG